MQGFKRRNTASETSQMFRIVIGDSAVWRTQTVEMFSQCKYRKTLVVNVGIQVVLPKIA